MSGRGSFRWEEDLRSSFLQFAVPELWTRTASGSDFASLCESTCSFGRADWVWASFVDRPQIKQVSSVAQLLQERVCSRILASLNRRSPRTSAYLQARSGVTEATYRKWLLRLRESMLITNAGPNSFTLGSIFPPLAMEICSFEFKLSNWRRALYQAKRYRTFSHRVFVVMPSSSIRPALRSVDSFRRFNIGLIEHDPSGESKRLVLPRKTEPASRSGLIRATGMLLNQGNAKPTSPAKSRAARIHSAK